VLRSPSHSEPKIPENGSPKHKSGFHNIKKKPLNLFSAIQTHFQQVLTMVPTARGNTPVTSFRALGHLKLGGGGGVIKGRLFK